MATDSVSHSMDSERTRTAFERLIKEQASLFSNTIDRNATLEARVEELERELNVWKVAMASAQKDARALQRQVAVTDDHPVVLALIDGDGCIFAQDLLSQGSVGGRQAATKLTRGLLESLADELKGRRADVWVVMFMNKRGLGDALNANSMCTQTEFDSFIHGFNQAGPLFSIVDVGPGKEAADNKVKECLRVLSRFPQMIKVFFGGAHDNGYSAPLKYLDHENLLSKVVLLKGYKDIAAELLALGLPTLEIEGLFLERKIVLGNYNNYPRPTSPTKRATVPANLADTSIMHGKMAKFVQQQQPSPTKLKHKPLKSPTQAHVTVIGQQLSKLVPPPCNLHYLASCPQGTDCRYGHHYKLTAEQIESVRINARKSPCPHANRNQYCPQGDDCIHGHYCPRGRKCFFLKKGQCKFVGKTMHDYDAEIMPGSVGSYGPADDDEYEGTGTGDEIADQDDSDYSQPLVMDFSEMESAMANLSVARGGSSSGQSRVKFNRTGSTSKDVLSSFVGSPGKKGYRVDSPGV